MTIDRDLVLYLEALARIRLGDGERDRCESDLQKLITYIDQLSYLNTEGVEPLSHSFPLTNVMREDVVTPSMDNDLLMANAPKEKDGCYLVHRTLS